MKLGLQIPDYTQPGGPPTLGADVAAVARTADDGGFDIVAVMDHLFQIGMVGPPEQDMLEAYTTLSFLAGHTSRARLIALVSGVSLRHPGMLMKQVSTLDVLSGGRAMLGIGAGWFEQEAVSLGVPFAPVAVRFEQLEEQLQIAHRMFSGSEEPFEGKHYRLERPLNHPAPLRRPPIMVGGSGERKTLRLVARYADACNLFAGPQSGPAQVKAKLDILAVHCAREGTDYGRIRKTILWAGPLDPAAGGFVEQMRHYADAGIDEVHVMPPAGDPAAFIDSLGQNVAPHLAGL
jgi:F420-dependent oxidoreductase-like protein